MGRFKSKLDTVKQTYRLCRLGGMPEPSWLEPYLQLCKTEGYKPGQTKSVRAPNTRRVQFPEDRLIQGYYDRHPNAKFDAVDLGSFTPPPVKQYAIRTLELIEKGWSRKQAEQKIETDMRASGELKDVQRPSTIQQIQMEEERVLMTAVADRKIAISQAETQRKEQRALSPTFSL